MQEWNNLDNINQLICLTSVRVRPHLSCDKWGQDILYPLLLGRLSASPHFPRRAWKLHCRHLHLYIQVRGGLISPYSYIISLFSLKGLYRLWVSPTFDHCISYSLLSGVHSSHVFLNTVSKSSLVYKLVFTPLPLFLQ